MPAASSGVYTSLPGSNQIWLDDVKCTGFETNVGECQRGVSLQQHHCNYDETAVCACHHTSSLPPTFTPGSSTAPRTAHISSAFNSFPFLIEFTISAGTCTSHQLGFYDATNNDVGIAKICTSPGQCSYICDDFWEQVDAQVFCSCLGYTEYARANFCFRKRYAFTCTGSLNESFRIQSNSDARYWINCSFTDVRSEQPASHQLRFVRLHDRRHRSGWR